MNNSIYKLTRDVTPEECPWLDRSFVKGTIMYEYSGCTYGCVGPTGTAMTLVENTEPFYEIPNTALTALDESIGAPR